MARLYSVGKDGRTRLAIEADGGLFDFAEVCRMIGKSSPPTDVMELLQEWASWERELAEISAYAHENRGKLGRLDSVGTRVAAPVPRPPKILCLAFNNRLSERFLDRFSKVGNPGWFMKSPTCVVGPEDQVELPPTGWSNVTTPEVELGVVLGKRARWVDREDALDVVAGYTIFNDVTAQDLLVDSSASISPQKYFSRKLVPDSGEQWEKDQLSGPNRIEMKQWDTFAPMGPCLVTKEDIPDPYSMEYLCKVNGETVMEGQRIELIWSIAEMVHKFSLIMTLEPGDVLSTGNVGRLSPRAVLKPGHVIEMRIGTIGTLRNECVASRWPANW